jgi:tetratricopeptide (TPR) repeat protein
MMGHVNKPLPDPRTFNPKISQEIVGVLNKALAKYPHERYDSTGALSEAFRVAVNNSLNLEGRPNAIPGGPPGPATHGTTAHAYPTGLAGNPTNSLPNAAAPQPAQGSLVPPPTPPQTTPTTGRFNPNTPSISSAQAYDFAVLQEEQGNTQAAFETFSDIFKREPSYRDVGARVRQYQAKGLQYTGQQTLFRPPLPAPTGNELTRSLPIGPYKNPTQQGTFIPQDPTGHRPISNGPATNPDNAPGLTGSQPGLAAAAPAPTKSPALLISLVAGLALVAIIAAVIFLVVLPGNQPGQPTVTVAVVPSTAPIAQKTSLAEATTVPTATTTAVTTPPVTTAVVTTAPVTTLAPTTPPSKPDPAGVQAMEISNAIYTPTGNLADGITKLKALAAANKDSWVTQRELGKAYFWYMREKGGVDYLKQAISLNPTDALSNAYLALAYSSIFEDTNAQAAITKARDLDPNSAEVLGAQSITLLRTDVIQAKAKAEAALKIDPDSLLGNYAKWASFVQTDEFSTALPYLEKLIARYPNLASLYADEGYHYLRQGDSNNATTAYNKALGIDPDYPAAHAGLCEIAYLGGDNNKAIEECGKAIAVYDYAVYGHVYLGYAYNNLGRSDEAEAELKKAIGLDIKNSTAYNGLAFTYIDRAVKPENATNKDLVNNLLNQAIGQADQAINLDSTYADAYFNRGYALFLLGRYTDATPSLERATELRKDSANYFTVLAYNYYKLTAKDKARAAAQQALAIDPNNQQAQEVLKAVGG